MPDDHKKPIQVKKIISPFGEVKGKKAPPWFDAIPGIYRYLPPIMVDRKLMLDPRKWKKKDLEDGSYAVAKYELALFATQLNQIEKEFTKELPPVKGKRDWGSIAKSKAPKDKSAAKSAEDSVKKCWEKLAKKIEDKVSLALDEVEADKGDNKKALANAKEALKKFNGLDTKNMFSGPVDQLVAAMKKLSTDLDGTNPDVKKALGEAQKKIASAEKDADRTAKSVQQVVKFFLTAGKKMAKDAKANAALQALGKKIVNESGDLEELLTAIEVLESNVLECYSYAKSEDTTASEARAYAKDLETDGREMDKIRKGAIGTVADIAKAFDAAQKEVKA